MGETSVTKTILKSNLGDRILSFLVTTENGNTIEHIEMKCHPAQVIEMYPDAESYFDKG